MADNMRIWNAVSKTDPDHTKEVSFGRKFTAIDAHYQVMMATEQFGPIGIGWGYDAGDPIFEAGAVIVPITLWHSDRSNTIGPVYGGADMAPKGKLDTDAPKKAGTDGLTKLLSQLGFNADVFLGKFDDSKYVASLKDEKRAEAPEAKAKSTAAASHYADDVAARLQTAADAVSAASILQDEQAKIGRVKTGYPDLFKRIEAAAKAAGAPMREAA